MREVGALSTFHSHPVALGRHSLATLLAHLQRRLGDLLTSSLRVAGVGVDVAVGTCAVEARSCVEVRARTEDGSGANEGESERLDLWPCERVSARFGVRDSWQSAHLLARLVLHANLDVATLTSDPVGAMHPRREVDLARSAHKEALGGAGDERLECRREEDGRVEVGEDFDVTVEVGDGAILAVRRLELDGAVRQSGQL